MFLAPHHFITNRHRDGGMERSHPLALRVDSSGGRCFPGTQEEASRAGRGRAGLLSPPLLLSPHLTAQSSEPQHWSSGKGGTATWAPTSSQPNFHSVFLSNQLPAGVTGRHKLILCFVPLGVFAVTLQGARGTCWPFWGVHRGCDSTGTSFDSRGGTRREPLPSRTSQEVDRRSVADSSRRSRWLPTEK